MSLITTADWDPVRESYGLLPALVGTLAISALALTLAAFLAISFVAVAYEFLPPRAAVVLGTTMRLGSRRRRSAVAIRRMCSTVVHKEINFCGLQWNMYQATSARYLVEYLKPVLKRYGVEGPWSIFSRVRVPGRGAHLDERFAVYAIEGEYLQMESPEGVVPAFRFVLGTVGDRWGLMSAPAKSLTGVWAWILAPPPTST